MDTDTPGLLQLLRRYRRWLALGVLVAGFAAASRFASIGVLPPSLKMKPFAHSTASTQVVVGWHSSLTAQYPEDFYLFNLSPRAITLDEMLASPQLRGYVARAAGLPVSKIAVDAPDWTDLQRIQRWNTGQKRASQIVVEKDPYQLSLSNDPYSPIIGVNTQAPTSATAARLAQAVATGLSAYVSDLQKANRTPTDERYDVRRLAPVTVVPPSKSTLANVGIFTFVAVFVLWAGLVLAVASVLRDLRAARESSKVHAAFDRSSHNRAGQSTLAGASTSTR